MKFPLALVLIPACVLSLPAARYVHEKDVLEAFNGGVSKLEEVYVQKVKDKKKGYLKKAQQSVCPVSAGGFTLITDNIPAGLASAACASLGMQLANIDSTTLLTVNAILVACLSSNAQINT